MSVANEKPEFETLLILILNELKVLKCGVNFDFGFKKFRQIQFFLLFGIFDKPARADIMSCSAEHYISII